MRIYCTRKDIPKDLIYVYYHDVKLLSKIHCDYRDYYDYCYYKYLEKWLYNNIDVKTEKIIIFSVLNSLYKNPDVEEKFKKILGLYNFITVCTLHFQTFVYVSSLYYRKYNNELVDLMCYTETLDEILDQYYRNPDNRFYHRKKFKYYIKQRKLCKEYCDT